jgi:integrase
MRGSSATLIAVRLFAIGTRRPFSKSRTVESDERSLEPIESRWIAGHPPPSRAGGKVRRLGAAVEVKHHEAMNWSAVPTFYRTLAELDTVESKALRFLILTGARASEVIGGDAKASATWGEIADVDGAPTWIIPAERMKAGRVHRVPLTAAAVALIGARGADDASLFSNLSEASLRTVLKACDGNGFTVHGFRASFRTWVAKATTFGDDLGELCIAHDKRSDVEKAYQRSDLLDKRREVMSAWAKFIGLR